MFNSSVSSGPLRFMPFSFMIFVFILGCSNIQDDSRQLNSSLDYAKGFNYIKREGYIELSIFQPNDQRLVYYLVNADSISWVPKNRPVIQVPIGGLICTSTTHLPWVEYLNVSDKLIGFPKVELIYSEKIRKQDIADVAGQDDISIEKILELKPDLLISNARPDQNNMESKLLNFGIPVLFTSEFLETHPLGRAEWIKLMGILTDRSAMADSIFEHIESSYITASGEQSQNKKPTVITGVPYGQTWFMPARNSYAAILFNDAGYNYAFDQESKDGILKPSIEQVYERAILADYWIGAGSYRSLAELFQSDHRFKSFGPVLKNQVYVYDLMTSDFHQGNGYFELATLRPDLLLKDLIKIRDTLYVHEFFFYRKL